MTRRLNRIRLKEISAVTIPAQPLALAHAIKGKDLNQKNDLVDTLSTINDNHRHAIWVEIRNGALVLMTSFATDSNGEYHDHKVVRENGGYQLISNTENGHTHMISRSDVETVLLNIKSKDIPEGVKIADILDKWGIKSGDTIDGDNSMTDQEKAEFEKLKEEKASLEATNASQEKILALSTDHRKHYDSIEDEKAKVKFLDMTSDKRDAAIKSSEEVEKSADTGGDDIANHPVVKALSSQIENLTGQLEEANLKSRLDEFKHLSGSDEEKLAMIKSLSSIEDEGARENLIKILKSKDEKISKTFVEIKTAGGTVQVDTNDPNSAYARLEELAKEAVKASASTDNPLTYVSAWEKVKTANPELYRASMNAVSVEG